MDLFDILLEPLSYDFMVRAIVTTALAAIVCAVLSCWLVLIGWSLMGDAVSHAVLPGVALAYIVGAPAYYLPPGNVWAGQGRMPSRVTLDTLDCVNLIGARWGRPDRYSPARRPGHS